MQLQHRVQCWGHVLQVCVCLVNVCMIVCTDTFWHRSRIGQNRITGGIFIDLPKTPYTVHTVYTYMVLASPIQEAAPVL